MKNECQNNSRLNILALFGIVFLVLLISICIFVNLDIDNINNKNNNKLSDKVQIGGLVISCILLVIFIGLLYKKYKQYSTICIILVAIYLVIFGVTTLYEYENINVQNYELKDDKYTWWLFDLNKTNQLLNLATASTISGVVAILFCIISQIDIIC
jgi:O-antigen/teichoic acid export membrane protein